MLELEDVIRQLLRPRDGVLVVCAIVVAFGWFQSDVTGLDRALTLAGAFVAAYLTFNATAVILERYA